MYIDAKGRGGQATHATAGVLQPTSMLLINTCLDLAGLITNDQRARELLGN